MTTDFQFDVFLSHSSKDKPVVRPLAERLRADGLKARPVAPQHLREGGFGEWMLKPDESIPAKIEDCLELSRVLARPAVVSGRRRMLCMSASALGSDWAQSEVGTFRFRYPLNKERRPIPQKLDDAPRRGAPHPPDPKETLRSALRRTPHHLRVGQIRGDIPRPSPIISSRFRHER